MNTKYCIVRNYDKQFPLASLPLQTRKRVVKQGLTLEEAKSHDEYFDKHFPCNYFHRSAFKDTIMPEEKCKKLKGFLSCNTHHATRRLSYSTAN
jgi:hypothetical protein